MTNLLALDSEFLCNDPSDIIEIGYCTFSGELSDPVSILVKSRATDFPETSVVTGIDYYQLEDSPSLEEALTLIPKCRGTILVWGFEPLLDYFPGCSTLDVQQYFSKFLNIEGKKTLSTACQDLGIPWVGKRHRAACDAYMTARVYLKMLKLESEGKTNMGLRIPGSIRKAPDYFQRFFYNTQ